jgi:hypothetical protein
MRLIALAALAALVLAAPSAASWPTSGAGLGRAKATTLVGSKSTAVTGIGSVTLTWAATSGATGYTIQRTGGVGVIGGTCTTATTSTSTATSCVDTPVVVLQTYTYTVTPLSNSWVGSPGPGTTVST